MAPLPSVPGGDALRLRRFSHGERAQAASPGVQESRAIQEPTRCLRFVRLLGCSVACLLSTWRLVLIELLGAHAKCSHVGRRVEPIRLGGHDTGHYGMTKNRDVDKWFAILVGDCFSGISMGC